MFTLVDEIKDEIKKAEAEGKRVYVEAGDHCGMVLDPFTDADAPYCNVCGDNHENPCNDEFPEPGEMRETD